MRIRATTVVIFVLCLSLTAVGFVAARSWVAAGEQAELERSADDVETAVAALAGGLGADIDRVIGVAAITEVNPELTSRAMDATVTSDLLLQGLIVVDLNGYEVLVSAGENDLTLSVTGQLIQPNADPMQNVVMKDTARGQRMAWVTPFISERGNDYALVSEFLFPGQIISDLMNSQFETVNIELYAGTTVDRSKRVISTRVGDGAPKNRTTQRLVNFASVTSTMVVEARDTRLGGLGPWESWLALTAGLVVTAILWPLTTRSSRRAEQLALLQQENGALQRQAELERRMQAAERLESLGRLAGGVAHDFNNLLAAIMSYGDLVIEELEEGPVRQDVEEIRSAARRGAELARQLLVFGRQGPVEPELIDLNELIRSFEGLLTRSVGADVGLNIDLGAGLPAVTSNSSELEQVLMNLVVNASHAIDGAGTIVISTREIEIDSEDVEELDGFAGRCVQLAVSDTGRGMEPDVITRAFEPFFTTKEVGEGTGLGLATVYGVAKRYGGTVQISSVVGSGTKIRVILPAAEGRPESVDKAPADQAEDGLGLTVLLVDDDDSVRSSSARMLARQGFDVLDAADAAQATAIAEEADCIDVLVTDLMLGGGDHGDQLAETILSKWPELGLVFMSGYSQEIAAERCTSIGSSQFLQKPFERTDLLQAVADVSTVPA